jgi:PHD/YefM family antitoxin component YafN of YafNO toxin-antitoxin module
VSKFALKVFEAKRDLISLLEHLRQSIAPILITRDDRAEAVLLRVEQYEELVRKLALDPVRWVDLVIDRAIREAESESFDEDTFDREYEEMQQAIWARTDGFSGEEIAEDIAAAIHEVKAEYRARRSDGTWTSYTNCKASSLNGMRTRHGAI